ncbi:Uncharacterised protein [Amycolatopsis camponoti]|uniref:Oxidoreductase n=1 Tax=Amycolatopsis camponoti TaxID=2606593 RepID=A0A6I8LKV6_9PSEU|nr:hypothetical protein [Amycolatopsis camponoti]VVJ15819.1 Uncharacterised protein [Amycolatopsis camponoti]
MDETKASPVLTDLTELEQQVVDAARCGAVAASATTMSVEDLAATGDPELRVRADLIRELLRGLHGDLDPHGIQIVGVRVVGRLDLYCVTAVTGLNLVRCAIPNGIVCQNAHLPDLNLNDSQLAHLHADGLRIDSNVFMRDVTITSTGEPGAIRLFDAHIGGQLCLERATITSTTGPALAADGLRTDSDLLMRDTTITSTGEPAAIRLIDARIGGSIDLERATITSTTDPALDADRLRTGSALFMDDSTIVGTGEHGAIRLLGAHIGGQISLRMSRLDNSSGPLLILQEAQITGGLLFPPTVVCPAGRQGMSRRDCPDGDRTFTTFGLTYPSLRDLSWRQWLHLLVHHTPAYTPQPFQQLAATERAAGHDNNAREVLITQQNELRRRTPEALGNRLARGRHALWGWLGRYGYRAHRLVTALAVVLTLAATLSLIAGHVTTHPGHLAAERVPPTTAKPTDPGTPCSPVELIGLGIDRGLPLGTTGIRAHCDLDTTTGWGQTFTATLWALQALLWGLATLAIAAYTGLVRKPT